jgi:hypothetical protein
VLFIFISLVFEVDESCAVPDAVSFSFDTLADSCLWVMAEHVFFSFLDPIKSLFGQASEANGEVNATKR